MEHHFNIEDAKKYGIEAAVLLNHIRFWVAKNEANNRHFYDGRYWTYNSVKAFAELFPYLSANQVRRALDKLEDAGILATGVYNVSSYDRTKWYSVNEQIHLANLPNQFDENDKSHLLNLPNQFGKNAKPIPDIKPYRKHQIITDIDEIEILKIFNEVMGTRYTGRSWSQNFKVWKKFYTMAEIETAIRNIPNDPFWKDKMTPEILFRQRNTAKEPVDYIGSLLNLKNPKSDIINQAQRLFEKWK